MRDKTKPNSRRGFLNDKRHSMTFLPKESQSQCELRYRSRLNSSKDQMDLVSRDSNCTSVSARGNKSQIANSNSTNCKKKINKARAKKLATNQFMMGIVGSRQCNHGTGHKVGQIRRSGF